MNRHLIIAALMFVPAFALAERGDRRPPRPPPEAVEACAEHAAGDTCSFEHDGHEIPGTCFTPDDDKPLACKPDEPPPPCEAP